jgi:hypothetical protein
VIALATTGQNVVYDPGTSVDINGGKVQPTAVRQTVTLLFGQALPAGSYHITLAPAIQAAPFSAGEASLLSGGSSFVGHPVVTVSHGTITPGSQVTATDLVLPNGALGDIHALKAGNAFLTQLHDDLDALLNAQQTQQGQGNHTALTPALIDQVLGRLEQALGTSGPRTTTAVALILDPVSFDVVDPNGDAVDYNLQTDTLSDDTETAYVDVTTNIEMVIDFNPPTDMGNIDLTVNDVPPDALGAAVVLGPDPGDVTVMDLTDELDSGTTQSEIPPD